MRAIDIETIPNKAMIEFMPEPEIALGNTKDLEKIKEKIAEAKAKAIDKMALSPLYGRICSFSACGEKPEDRYFKVIPEISDAAEIEIINHILETFVLGQNNDVSSKIITWNGFNFDFPFIYKRAAMLKVAMPQGCPGLKYWQRKYSSDIHCDLMQEFCGWGNDKAMNLDAAGKTFLGRGKTQRDYSTYADLIETGKGELIGLDNLCDTQLTFDLYNHLAPYLF
jgi:DNA polymerase elongation subunit (family B)